MITPDGPISITVKKNTNSGNVNLPITISDPDGDKVDITLSPSTYFGVTDDGFIYYMQIM